MRWLVLAGFILVAETAPLAAQAGATLDVANVARAVAVEVLAHPIEGGGGRAPATHVAIDSMRGDWNLLVGRAAQAMAPARVWVDHRDPEAANQLHVEVHTVIPRGDSLAVTAVWRWCFPRGGGQTGWPVTFMLARSDRVWRVVRVEQYLFAHARDCTVAR